MSRPLLVALLFAAAPAAAQDVFDPYWMGREAELRAQQELSRQRGVALQNEITALEMRLQAERSMQNLELQARRPQLVEPVPRPAGAAAGARGGPSAGLGGFIEIPADRLAASNERVRAASRPAR